MISWRFYVSLALLKPFDVDSYYLDKSLQSPSAKEELYRRTLHIAFPKKINKNQIAEVMLPIPRSRQEQEQIVLFSATSTPSSPFISVSANTVAYAGIFLGNSVSWARLLIG